ncbi:MAG TPA: hypothetical protein GXZ90_00390 [Clostridiales bacterium]|nr:hypothetical protein [Clostridiales bacterium]
MVYLTYFIFILFMTFILLLIIAVTKENKQIKKYDEEQKQQKQDLINLKLELNSNYCPTVIHEALLEMKENELKYYRKNKPIINVKGDALDLVEIEMQYENSNNENNVFEMAKDKFDNIDFDSIDLDKDIILQGHMHLNEKSPYLFTLKDCEIVGII